MFPFKEVPEIDILASITLLVELLVVGVIFRSRGTSNVSLIGLVELPPCPTSPFALMF